MLKNNFSTYFASLFLFLFPLISFAELRINEVMYDVPGTDTGREWVEIFNDGNDPIDVSSYTFREANTNHKLEIVQGAASIAPSGFAVIADDSAKFLADNPSFTSSLFESSFSLSNTGETLALRKDDIDVDSITYNSTLGAQGDGNTLGRSGNSFIVVTATPGKANTTSSHPTEDSSETSENEIQQEVQTQKTTGAFKADPQVYADAGIDKTVMVGVSTEFSGMGYGVKKEPLQTGRYVWNMGDGSVKEGKKIEHMYRFPGRYTLNLNVSSGEYSQGDTAIVTVLPPSISIGERKIGQGGFIEIKNTGNHDIDISGIMLKTASNIFSFPKGTIISSLNSIKFANEITSLYEQANIGIFYANNTPVVTEATSAPTSVPVVPSVSSITKVSSNTSVVKEDSGVAVQKTGTISETKNINAAAALGLLQKEKPTENSKENNTIWLYLLGVLVISGLSISAVLLQKKGTPSLAEEYEIIEE